MDICLSFHPFNDPVNCVLWFNMNNPNFCYASHLNMEYFHLLHDGGLAGIARPQHQHLHMVPHTQNILFKGCVSRDICHQHLHMVPHTQNIL